MTRMRFLLLTILAALLLSGLLLCASTEEAEGIAQVRITGEALWDLKDKQDVRQAVLSFDDGKGYSFSMPVTIHIQGNAQSFPKKNYTIKFQQKIEMSPGWGAHKKYTLKANYNDPTMARNIVSARLAAQMQHRYHLLDTAPNAGLIDGFPIWLEIDGEPAGLYNWTIPKDEWMFGMDKDDPDHLLFFGNDWTDDVFFSSDEIDYAGGWIPKTDNVTSEGFEKFERLYRFIHESSDETFRSDIGQYMSLDACLNYSCFCYIAYAADNAGKNMILGTYDGLVWWPSLYDLDETWGNCWDGKAYRENKDFLLSYSGLLRRILTCFPDELRARYHELRDDILSKDNILAEFERYRSQIPQEYFDRDKALWFPDQCPYPDYDELESRIAEYLPVYDEYFGYHFPE